MAFYFTSEDAKVDVETENAFNEIGLFIDPSVVAMKGGGFKRAKSPYVFCSIYHLSTVHAKLKVLNNLYNCGIL